jgi:hypothetical protein
MDVAAVNSGYSHIKWRYKKRRGIFPSVRGPAREMIMVEGQEDIGGIVLRDDDGREWFVGDLALEHCGRVVSRPEGRDWVSTEAYLMYWRAAFSEMSGAVKPVGLKVVSGLPIDYYREQKIILNRRIQGEHQFCRAGRGRQTFRVAEVVVLPELMGSLFCCVIDRSGKEHDNVISLGDIGIVDVGGHNVNFMGVKGMVPRRDESRTTDAGCWQAVSQVRRAIDREYPGLGLHDHEVVDCMIARQVKWRGRLYDIGGVVDDAVVPLAEATNGVISQLWNGAARKDAILLTGGGALLCERYICDQFAQGYPPGFVQVFGGNHLLPELAGLIGDVDPVFGNVEGMYRYGLYLWP